MKAMIFRGPKQVTIENIPEPEVGPDDVLVRPLAVSFCFSELHMYHGLWGHELAGCTLGHEGVGVVQAIGSNVEGWSVGDKAVYDPTLGCGCCDLCNGGLRRACFTGPAGQPFGLFADLFAAPAYRWRPVPAELTVSGTANIEPFSVGTRHMRHSGITTGDNVVFFGLDDYAGSALQWAAASGLGKIAVVEPTKIRQDYAMSLGVDRVIDPSKENVPAAVREIMPFGADAAFVSAEEYIPHAYRYLGDASRSVRLQGRLNIIRAYNGAIFEDFPGMEFWAKEQTLTGAGIAWADENWRGGQARGDFQATMDGAVKGHLDMERGLTKFSWDEIDSQKQLEEILNALPHEIYKAQFTFAS
ncbi:zinc-binding dehydrogenase [Rhodococcus sp. NPDC057014]|uniref:zinc-dependent alcohol dehydrogenase n=1 Tax=Rhodococcus sp. NPDC057014 TaxID=3346000 RepID=UPI00363198E1